MALPTIKQKKENKYVWRLDFSLLEETNHNSEIGREVRKHRILYKSMLLIGGFGWWLLFLTVILLFIYHADLIYIGLAGIAVLITGLLFGRVFTIPKMSRSDMKKLEDEVNLAADRIETLDVFFAESTMIIQQGILVFRIPYLEIADIRVKLHANRQGGIRVRYRLRDGAKIETVYYGLGIFLSNNSPFELLWERLKEYNPNIIIEDS